MSIIRQAHKDTQLSRSDLYDILGRLDRASVGEHRAILKRAAVEFDVKLNTLAKRASRELVIRARRSQLLRTRCSQQSSGESNSHNRAAASNDAHNVQVIDSTCSNAQVGACPEGNDTEPKQQPEGQRHTCAGLLARIKQLESKVLQLRNDVTKLNIELLNQRVATAGAAEAAGDPRAASDSVTVAKK